jgi:hypothetical protein
MSSDARESHNARARAIQSQVEELFHQKEAEDAPLREQMARLESEMARLRAEHDAACKDNRDAFAGSPYGDCVFDKRRACMASRDCTKCQNGFGWLLQPSAN